MRDGFSNAVHVATGSGSSLQHDWNGTSDGGTNLPAGVYYYYISAQTNGQPYTGMAKDGSGSSAANALAADSMELTELWAVPPDGSGPPVPLAIYPPGPETNGLTIFEATPSEVRALAHASATRSTLVSGATGGPLLPQPLGADGGSSASSQNTAASPQRLPTDPIVGISGLFGIAYDTYTANGTNAMSAPLIQNIPGVNGSYIALDGYPANSHLTYSPLPEFTAQANNFISEMQTWG